VKIIIVTTPEQLRQMRQLFEEYRIRSICASKVFSRSLMGAVLNLNRNRWEGFPEENLAGSPKTEARAGAVVE